MAAGSGRSSTSTTPRRRDRPGLPPPGTPTHDQFTEHPIGLDHVAIGVRIGEVGRLTELLDAAGVTHGGVKAEPMGPAMVTFRDPDNIQWEFFERP
jgi:catechol 2,3-dioxygenase-like lactoylglutathione lyase family enzyme